MRLAFSVAAHLEPDILVVDEVLAVGDAAFQKKCLGKMGNGRAARPHGAVRESQHGRGGLVMLARAAARRRAGCCSTPTRSPSPRDIRRRSPLRRPRRAISRARSISGRGKARFVSLRFVPERRDGTTREMMCPGSRLRIETRIVCSAPVDSANVGITIYDASGYRLIDANTAMQGRFVSMKPGDEARVDFALDDVRLKPGTYLVGLWMGRGNVEDIDGILYAATLEVEPDPQQLQHSEQFPGSYLCAFQHSVVISSPPRRTSQRPSVARRARAAHARPVLPVRRRGPRANPTGAALPRPRASRWPRRRFRRQRRGRARDCADLRARLPRRRWFEAFRDSFRRMTMPRRSGGNGRTSGARSSTRTPAPRSRAIA